MNWLVDTNGLSELRKPHTDPNVVAFFNAQALRTLYVSVVTFAEIRYGIERVTNNTEERAKLTTWLDTGIRPLFEGRVLPISEDVMLIWRQLVERGRKSGHTFSQPDLLIAATGIQYQMTVVTRNVRDYEMAGVAVLNPWLPKGA